MSAASDCRRELAHRASDGIEVSLFWSESTNQITIELVDARFDEGFEFEVSGSAALEAFRHPYAYAPTHSRPCQATGAVDDERRADGPEMAAKRAGHDRLN